MGKDVAGPTIRIFEKWEIYNEDCLYYASVKLDDP
jgi:hypothetical protein